MGEEPSIQFAAKLYLSSTCDFMLLTWMLYVPLSDNNLYLLSPSTTHESDFATFHSTLVKKGIPKQAQKGMSVSFSVKALRGNMEQLRKDFALLINKNTIVVNKLGFPDVILPGKCIVL